MPETVSRKQFSTYLPPDLKAWLEARGHRNFRSMNAELIAILSAAKQADAGKGGA